MAYVSNEEFSEPEKKGQVGLTLWPYWHYGVLLLYGQNIAVNHFIGANQSNVVKLEEILDYPSANIEPVYSKMHIHVSNVHVITFKPLLLNAQTCPKVSKLVKKMFNKKSIFRF